MPESPFARLAGEKYLIALDAMGGDGAPAALVEGAAAAAGEFPDIRVALLGPIEAIERELRRLGAPRERLAAIDAPEAIGYDEPPMLAVRRKVRSPVVMGALAVKGGEADALVTAGPTGALLACGLTRVGRVSGVERPALATIFPGRDRPFVLIDSGANVDCTPAMLSCFGLMGSIYSSGVLGVERPSVMLLNNGSEAGKGNRLAQAAYAAMGSQGAYRFEGNIEARDVPLGAADVVVADGFDGNIILKYTEGLASALIDSLKAEMSAGLRVKLGAALAMPALRAFKRKMDYEEYGGAPLLGTAGALVKAHGSSGARAIKNAIGQARAMAANGVSKRIEEEIRRLAPEGASGGNDDIR